MQLIEINDISNSPSENIQAWFRKQMAELWQVPLEDVDAEIKRNFDSEHLSVLYQVPDKESSEVEPIVVFNEKDDLISVWKRNSHRSFLEWARINSLDVFPRVMSGRYFSDEDNGLIYHALDSDYLISQLVRSYPATVKQILQWNGKTHFDQLKQGNTIKFYKNNAPAETEWPEGKVVLSHQGERLYCMSPFRELILVRDGSYFCCSAWHGFPSIGDPITQSLDGLWNGEMAVEFRKSILDGSYRYCRHDVCPRLINSCDLQTYDELHPSMQYEVAHNGGSLARKFEFINYGFDASCNLSCPSCRKEVIIAQGQEAEDIVLIENQIEANGQDLQELYISGAGDVFGSPYARAFLSRMTFEKFPSLYSIYLHCNGQLFNEFTWNKLPEFVRERIQYVEISIDGASLETYEENRRGGSFERLVENLKFIRDLRLKGDLGYIKFSFVVQENNYQEIPDFVNFAKQNAADSAFFCRIMNWGAFSQEEYKQRDIANQEHPEFSRFVEVLEDKLLLDPIVDLTNLSALKR